MSLVGGGIASAGTSLVSSGVDKVKGVVGSIGDSIGGLFGGGGGLESDKDTSGQRKDGPVGAVIYKGKNQTGASMELAVPRGGKKGVYLCGDLGGHCEKVRSFEVRPGFELTQYDKTSNGSPAGSSRTFGPGKVDLPSLGWGDKGAGAFVLKRTTAPAPGATGGGASGRSSRNPGTGRSSPERRDGGASTSGGSANTIVWVVLGIAALAYLFKDRL